MAPFHQEEATIGIQKGKEGAPGAKHRPETQRGHEQESTQLGSDSGGQTGRTTGNDGPGWGAVGTAWPDAVAGAGSESDGLGRDGRTRGATSGRDGSTPAQEGRGAVDAVETG
jgi:hypothetical protein